MLAVSLLVLLLVVVSALGVIYSSYKSRQLFSEVQQQNREAMRLEEDWGRLLLEQSTWASHARIERLAKSELKMVVPAPETIIVVKR
ncbi:MAG: cell division protein FtsL [Oceanicoccus sp.]|nr:cell division protein FtsL [Oceanicoccus sp.]